MAGIDDHIAKALRDSQRSGELQSAPSWGKPMDLRDAGDATPEELRLPYKVLKDAGMLPVEVVLMKRVADLKRKLQAASDPDEAEALRQRLSDLQQNLALRMEALRRTKSI